MPGKFRLPVQIHPVPEFAEAFLQVPIIFSRPPVSVTSKPLLGYIKYTTQKTECSSVKPSDAYYFPLNSFPAIVPYHLPSVFFHASGTYPFYYQKPVLVKIKPLSSQYPKINNGKNEAFV
jgi:hypothetical protein